MKSQTTSIRKAESRNRRNQILGLYIIFVIALTITYSLVTASQVL